MGEAFVFSLLTITHGMPTMKTTTRSQSLLSRFDVTDLLAIAGMCLAILVWASQGTGSIPDRSGQAQLPPRVAN
jgi:hypothetical protein